MRYGIHFAFAVTLIGAGHAGPVFAQEEIFRSGNTFYQQAEYQQAIDSYENLLEAGYESAGLFYNLGNAYFKLGNLGKSILFYERARELDSGNDDIKTNLELAQSLAADEITPLPKFWLFKVTSWVVHLVPRATLRMLTGSAYAVTVLSVSLALLGVAVTGSKRVAIGAGIATLLLSVNLAVIELGIGKSTRAVVMAPEAAVYSAPAEDPDLLLFNVHEGTVVRIDQIADDWYEVVLLDGKVGWLRADATETI